MKLRLINDLNESKMYRTSHAFKRVTARQVADHAFMDLIALWILYNEYEFAPHAISYATKTGQFHKFNRYIQSGSDLYLSLHVISQKRTDLLNTDADQVALDRYTINEKQVVRYLRMMANNSLDQGTVRVTLQRLEQSLYIENSNYRSVRRLAQSWPTLSTEQKRVALTRMILFYKTHARRSEIFSMLSLLANSKNLNDPNAKNPELPGVAKAAAIGAAGYAAFQGGRRFGKTLF